MKSVSHLTLAAMLALGLSTAPALAQKKEKAAAVKGPNFSKEFRAAAMPVQAAITAKDYATASTGLAALDAAAVSPDEKYYASTFRYQTSAALKDEKGATAGVEGMLASGVAPASQIGILNLHLGRDAYFKKDYARAMPYLDASIRAGNPTPEVLILAADVSFKQKQFAPGLAFAERAITAQKALGQPVTEDWYSRALAGAYNSKNGPEMIKWSGMLVRAYPTPENWRSALVLYRDSKTLDPQILLDLYRLMRATRSIAGERDYFDYAAIASERGLPGETKAVVDEGFASGKVPAASRQLGELRTSASAKVTADLASLPASERSAASAPTGRGAMSTADAYLGYGQYAKAVPLYRTAMQKGGIDMDTANTRLGIALARSGDKEGARAAFAAVKGARAEVAAFWTLYLDIPTTAA